MLAHSTQINIGIILIWSYKWYIWHGLTVDRTANVAHYRTKNAYYKKKQKKYNLALPHI